MNAVIKKGRHRPGNWWRYIRLWYNKKSISRVVTFGPSCNYDLNCDDQNDLNKLFGLGFLWNRKDSIRFCWNWKVQPGKIVLYAYFHMKGMSNSRNVSRPVDFVMLCEVYRFRPYRMTIEDHGNGYRFSVSNPDNSLEYASTIIPKNHNKKWSFWLGPFFGGNRTAPHDIEISIRK